MEMNKLRKQVKKLNKEIQELETESIRPDILKDPSKIKDISRNLTNKQKELSILEKLLKVSDQLTDTEEILKNETGKELLALAREDIRELEIKKKKFEEELNVLKNGPSQKDIKECILEIRAGTGGEEANLFASDLFRMYTQYAQSKGWKVQVLSKHQTGKGGFKEIIVQVSGKNSYNSLQFESGVHRVQRVPVTESSGRIHTSAASVVVYPLLEDSKINIASHDLKIDVYRSSGPGGQSVNTTDSAVRITHIPTGTTVTCQDEKSQHKNKKKALSVLAARLADLKTQQQQEEVSEIRKSAIKTGDRSAKIRTYNFPQNRVTDHRIKKSWHNLKNILDGNLDKVITDIASG